MNNNDAQILLQNIFNYLIKYPKIVNILKDSCTYDCHFGIGIHIRNKYLWNNESNFLLLSEYYKKYTVDDISEQIIKDFYHFYLSLNH